MMPEVAVHLPLTYQALAVEQPGQPLRKIERTIQSLQKDEVLIRVSHASVNSMDIKMAESNGWGLPPPYVLGFDISGEVVATGGHGRFHVGDQVFGGSLKAGGFAEYVATKTLFLRPRGSLPWAEASTYGIAYMTAYESLMITGNLAQHPGAWIYVAGGAGGVGHFAVQLAQRSGLKVIASAGKPASFDLLKKLGVGHIVDYRRQDVVAEVLQITGGKGVDFVYDPTYSAASYRQSAAVIARGGLYIRLGTRQHMERAGLDDVTDAVKARGARLAEGDQVRYGKNPYYMLRALKLFDGLKRAESWYRDGTVRPQVTQIVPFDAVALQKAFDAFAEGTNNVGKVVVQCGSTLA